MEVQKSRAGALKDVVFRGCLCFTVSAVLYTAVMSLMLADSAGEPAAVFTLLFQNFLIILAASAVFGASFLIFDAKGLPSAAKRTIHVVLLYATMLGAFLLAILAPIAASIIQMAISRTREYDADEDGSLLTGDPEALASALNKISYGAQTAPMRKTAGTQSVSAMMIANPFSAVGFSRLFSTHPPTDERIARLMQMANEMNGTPIAPPTYSTRCIGLRTLPLPSSALFTASALDLNWTHRTLFRSGWWMKRAS